MILMHSEESEVSARGESGRGKDSKRVDQALKCYLGVRTLGEPLGAGVYSPLLQQELYLQLFHALQGEQRRAALSCQLPQEPLCTSPNLPMKLSC